MACFLGIDGGGSKTTFLLGDDSNVLASVTAGGSNIVRLGEDQARDVFQRGIHQICHQSGINPTQIVALCAGVAGAARDDIREKVMQLLAKLVPGEIEVVGDMVIAHEAALGGSPGIVVVSGTGSMAYGRHPCGRTARAGGWGYAISDEGSGYWIGVQAVAAVTHALDVGACIELGDRILKLWHLDSYDELITRANSSPPPDFASLVEVVSTAAEAGDSYAQHILIHAGAQLAELAKIVFQRLWQPDDVVNFALTGGVFQHAAIVRESFKQEIRSHLSHASVFLSQESAAKGALVMARKLPVDPQRRSRITTPECERGPA